MPKFSRRFGLLLGSHLLGACLMLGPQAASAKVAQVDERGFVIQHMVDVPADAETTWSMILQPAKWWDSKHTWSGDSANLSLDGKAGGCFCEILTNPDSPRAAPLGSVEHMHVVYIERQRVLRLTGALGPLQSDAVSATMTIQLKPVEGEPGKTRILLEYVVGGYLRRPTARMAPSVDAMLAVQVEGLVAKLGGAFASAFPSPEALDALVADQAAQAVDEGAADVPEGDARNAPLENDAASEAKLPSGIEPLAETPPEGAAVGR